MHPNWILCPACRSRHVIQYGHTRRVFKTLPVGHKKVELAVDIPRLFCKDCGAIRQANLEFAEPKKHYTKSLEQYVIDLCCVMTLQDAAELTGLSWDTVKDIHKAHLRRRYTTIDLKKVRYLALDEVYLGHKRKFVTFVMDLETGRVIHVGPGKGKDALLGFWRRLKRSRAKIEAVATDMTSGYIAAVLEHLPQADLVLDHFHLFPNGQIRYNAISFLFLQEWRKKTAALNNLVQRIWN